MKTIEFKKALGQLLSAEKTAAAGIVDLARVAIDHYHNNSFNRDLIEAMIDGLQRRPQLLNKFKSIVADTTVKKGTKKADKAKAKIQARRGYAWFKQQAINSLIEYIRYEKRATTGINKRAPAATFASQRTDVAQAVLDAEKKVNKLKADLTSAQQALTAACDMAKIPAPTSETAVVQDPQLIEKINKLEEDNDRLIKANESLPTLKDQLKAARVENKMLKEENLLLQQQLKEMVLMLDTVRATASKSRTKAAQEIASLLATA